MIRSVGRALLQYFFCGLYCYFKNGFPLPSRGRCGLMISRRRRLSVTRSGNLCGCEGYNREGNFSDAQNFDGTIDNANVLPYFVKQKYRGPKHANINHSENRDPVNSVRNLLEILKKMRRFGRLFHPTVESQGKNRKKFLHLVILPSDFKNFSFGTCNM